MIFPMRINSMNKNNNKMLRKCISFLALCGCGTIMAQTSYPGGVQSPLVWFKAEAVDQNMVNGTYQWINCVDKNNVIMDCRKQNSPVAPVQRGDINTYNFNPSVPFKTTDSLQFNVKGGNLRQTTIIGVYGYNQDELSHNSMVYRIEGEDGVLLTRDKLYHVDGSESNTFEYKGFIVASPSKKDEVERVKIITYQRAQKPDFSIWADVNAKIDLGSVFRHEGDASVYPLKNPDEPVTSYLSELMVYGRSLSKNERIQAETYLAFKYGITLNGGMYITRGGIDVTPSNKYRVFAYGKDDKAGFNQPSSTTSYEEKVYMLDDTYHNNSSLKLSSEFNLLVAGFSNEEDMADSSYVIIGDNNKSSAPKDLAPAKNTEEEIKKYNETYHYMQREWSLKTVNVDPQVKHTFELGYFMTEGGVFGKYRNMVKKDGKDESQVFLVVSKEGAFEESNTDLIYYPMTSLDEERKKIIFEDVLFPSESMKFTFAYKGVPDESYDPKDSTDLERKVMKYTEYRSGESNDMEIKEPGEGIEEVVSKSAITWFMYSDPKSDDKGFTVKVTMENPEPVSFLVFDIHGRFVAESTVKPSDTVAEDYIRVPSKGVYVVKMITEKTKNVLAGKILIK